MGKGCMNADENIYFACRKEAAKYNDRLNSRDSAADLLGVSVSSLADYELGNTKVVPVDKVVLMADLYNSPELCTFYCANECPIGKRKAHPCGMTSIELSTVRLLDVMNLDEVKKRLELLIHLAAAGKIEDIDSLQEIIDYLDRIRVEVEQITLVYQKAKGEKNVGA